MIVNSPLLFIKLSCWYRHCLEFLPHFKECFIAFDSLSVYPSFPIIFTTIFFWPRDFSCVPSSPQNSWVFIFFRFPHKTMTLSYRYAHTQFVILPFFRVSSMLQKLFTYFFSFSIIFIMIWGDFFMSPPPPPLPTCLNYDILTKGFKPWIYNFLQILKNNAVF